MCEEGAVKWIATAFGDCVYTPRDQLSFWIGMISNVIWVVSAVPQYYKNCIEKNVDGQSPFFFSLIFTGNVLSLVGVIVTHGLPTQIITSVLYCILDGLLFLQWVMFRYCCRRERRLTSSSLDEEDYTNNNKNNNNIDEDSQGDETKGKEGSSSSSIELEKEKHNNNDKNDSYEKVESLNENRDNNNNNNGHYENGATILPGGAAGAMLFVAKAAAVDYSIPYRGDNLIGSIFGWVGTAIYIGSRVPQVIENFKVGVVNFSALYMLFMVLGNLTYALSLFVRSLEADFLWLQAPFLVGALFPMTCDLITLIQILVNRCRQPKKHHKKSKKKKEEGDLSSDQEDREMNEI